MTNEPILLSRDCDATQIPSGAKLSLPEGTEVFITQSLGGSYTVTSSYGMARIEAWDGDALGFEAAEKPIAGDRHEGPADQDMLWKKLKTVYDPEIPVNIVDLGLVYDMQVKPAASGRTKVEVKMTLTAPGCGMGPTIQADAREKLLSVPGVEEADVELVWEPPWNQDMISEVGRMQLGMV